MLSSNESELNANKKSEGIKNSINKPIKKYLEEKNGLKEMNDLMWIVCRN